MKTMYKSLYVLLTAVCIAVTSSFGADAISAEKYKYYIPLRPNMIQGVVMSERGDYKNVRYEDIAWLMNAITERRQAIVGMDDFAAFATNTYASITNSANKFPLMSDPESSFISAGIGYYGQIRFNHPSNVFSSVSQLVTEGEVIEVNNNHSNVYYSVTNILTRTLESGVSVHTNVYNSSSNVYYEVETTNNHVVSDFCFENAKDYSDVRYDMEGLYAESVRPKQGIMNLYSITNLFGFLKDNNVGVAKSLNVAYSILRHSDKEYYRVVPDEYGVSYETNKEYSTTNKQVKVSIRNSKSDSESEYRNYRYDAGDEDWKLYNTDTDESQHETSNDDNIDTVTYYISTPITTNAYNALNGEIPIVKVKCYALANVSAEQSSGASWSVNLPDGKNASTNKSQGVSFQVMIPIGESTEVCTTPEPTNSTDKICFKLEVVGIGTKLKDAALVLTNNIEVYYKTFPSYGFNPTAQFVNMYGDDDDDPSSYKNRDRYAGNSLNVSVSGLYGVFFYDFETKLEHWTKTNEDSSGGE